MSIYKGEQFIAGTPDLSDYATKSELESKLSYQIGQIIQVACSSSYTPDGCLACDGSEYTNAQFPKLWSTFLIGGKLNTCTYSQYESEITEKGYCGKIALDTTNNKFKVPTLLSKLIQDSDNSIAVRGNGMSLGFTDGTNLYGINTGNAGGGYMHFNTLNAYGANVGTANSSVGNVPQGKVAGITTDSSKSGIVADLSSTEVRYFICVANGTVNDSQMNWSEWASNLSSKANADLSNVLSNIDYIVEYDVNTDGSWFRRYKSGWLEQGGTVTFTAPHTGTTYEEFIFNKSFKDLNYTFIGLGGGTTKSPLTYKVSSKTTKSIMLGTYGSNATEIMWEAKGQGA